MIQLVFIVLGVAIIWQAISLRGSRRLARGEFAVCLGIGLVILAIAVL